MEKKKFDEIARRLLEVNKLITQLDPAIRGSAFEFLKPYVSSGSHPQAPAVAKSEPGHSGSDVSLETLISEHGDNKPDDNAKLLTADWYGKYGTAPFRLSDIREAANHAGLTIPKRIDMTFKRSTDDGKKLYQSSGNGQYAVTVPGELYLKKVYGVHKGTGVPPTAGKK